MKGREQLFIYSGYCINIHDYYFRSRSAGSINMQHPAAGRIIYPLKDEWRRVRHRFRPNPGIRTDFTPFLKGYISLAAPRLLSLFFLLFSSIQTLYKFISYTDMVLCWPAVCKASEECVARGRKRGGERAEMADFFWSQTGSPKPLPRARKPFWLGWPKKRAQAAFHAGQRESAK